MTIYLDKKEIPTEGEGILNQYFLMGIDYGDVNILRTALQVLIDNMVSKTDLAPEEAALYRKVFRLYTTLQDE